MKNSNKCNMLLLSEQITFFIFFSISQNIISMNLTSERNQILADWFLTANLFHSHSLGSLEKSHDCARNLMKEKLLYFLLLLRVVTGQSHSRFPQQLNKPGPGYQEHKPFRNFLPLPSSAQ